MREKEEKRQTPRVARVQVREERQDIRIGRRKDFISEEEEDIYFSRDVDRENVQ